MSSMCSWKRHLNYECPPLLLQIDCYYRSTLYKPYPYTRRVLKSKKEDHETVYHPWIFVGNRFNLFYVWTYGVQDAKASSLQGTLFCKNGDVLGMCNGSTCMRQKFKTQFYFQHKNSDHPRKSSRLNAPIDTIYDTTKTHCSTRNSWRILLQIAISSIWNGRYSSSKWFD